MEQRYSRGQSPDNSEYTRNYSGDLCEIFRNNNAKFTYMVDLLKILF